MVFTLDPFNRLVVSQILRAQSDTAREETFHRSVTADLQGPKSSIPRGGMVGHIARSQICVVLDLFGVFV